MPTYNSVNPIFISSIHLLESAHSQEMRNLWAFRTGKKFELP